MTADTITIEVTAETIIEIISLSGEMIVSEDLGVLDAEVRHTWTFDDVDKLTNGTYLYRIISGGQVLSGKMQLIK